MRLVQMFAIALSLVAIPRPLTEAVPFIVLRTNQHPTALPVQSAFILTATPLDPGRTCVEEPSRRVLLYLRDMMDLCRNFHRPDLLDEYSEAWEFAATRIYGPLPARKPNQGYYPAPIVEPKTPTIWRQQMAAKPYRKIVRRFSSIEAGLTIDYEQLACGHRVTAKIALPDELEATRRRCSQCAREEAADKKQPASVATETRKKGATA